MKNKPNKILAFAALLMSASSFAPSAFAANQYGIEYSGGAPLSASNVQINPTLIESLTPLIKTSGVEVEFSNSSKWQDGFYKGSTCYPVKYVDVTTANPVTQADNLSVTFSKNQYTIKVQFKNITLDGVTDSTKKVPMTIIPGYTSIYGSWPSYTDATCTTPSEGTNLSAKDGERIFIDMDIKLYRNGQEAVFTADDLYFGITDIDASQSFKILNSGNEFSPSNMFAKNAADLQTTNPDIALRNMYVANGNYLYTQYDQETGIGLDTPDNSNIYTKLTKATQQNGLNIVFGFAGGAASAIEYYAQQYTVNYISDQNGSVTGITEEQIISGSYPSGTETIANEDYEFKHWIANVDLPLADGTIIRAGNPISETDMRNVTVNQNITFTAIHDEISSPIAVPDTGSSTGQISAMLAPISIFGILVITLAIRSLPILTHKKVDFNK